MTLEIRNPKIGVPIYNLRKSPDEEESIMGGIIKIIEKRNSISVQKFMILFCLTSELNKSIQTGRSCCRTWCVLANI